MSKLTDCDAENTETEIWFQFCFDCTYIDEIKLKELLAKSAEAGKMLGQMLSNSEKYL